MLPENSELPVVQFLNVTKKIGSKTIIDNLTLDIPRGRVFGFLGPNGSGKTTTIRMLVGLMSITSGDILIEGQNIRTHFEEAIAKVGAIVENPEMYKYMSGYQNLMQYARMSPGVDKQRISDVVQFVGLGHRIYDKVSTYSLGMRQRLGVAQALLHRPRLLVLDEPTNGLDPQGIRELRDYLRALSREEGTTVFVSSHLLSEMELMCDTVAVINGGRLVDVRHLDASAATADTTGAKMMVRFETDQPALAAQLGGGGQISGSSWTVAADRQDIARLNALLVNNGIAVYSITPIRETLEDQFLAMTREGERHE
ncbi:bacitracin ABC transporter ATP-binding protein [Paenibacillus bovis]|uniref:Bacitracin ABC transporter ATP-binding protein n=1 Tax=Paenibacillus bovis TaxID=1616788 RepID=A0A172ZM24_9BACL|nr:bacitracin ABC transporter ATP-binding protein [Paenibacillus bovis]